MKLSYDLDQVYYLSKKQLFNSWRIKRKVNPIYLKSCLFFGATLIDRTKSLDTGIEFSIIDQIPLLKPTNTPFEVICEDRAREIIDCTEGTIKVLWSGGIDSTVALIALIKELKPHDNIDRLLVLYSEESMNEYPSFFHEVIEGKLHTECIKTTIFDHIKPNETIVTGEHGDQLFGSDKLKYPVLTGDAFRPYDEILDFIISRKLGTEKYTQNIIDFIQPVIEESPIKIETLYDYMWWLNFSLKWQTVSMRLIQGLGRSHHDLEKNVFHFFKSENFQQWSLTNHTIKIKKEWKSYKFVAKEYIYSFHKDKFYFINKEKEQSLKEVLVNEQANLIWQYPKQMYQKLKFRNQGI